MFNRMGRKLFAVVFACLAGLATGAMASAQSSAQSSSPVKVVASFSIIADMVQQVGGPLVQVHSLVGPDSDAHVFNPTPNDARQLAKADMVVINGMGYEGWIERLIKASGFRGPVVVASDGISAIAMGDDDQHDKPSSGKSSHQHSHTHGSKNDQRAMDPHAWQDLNNAKVYVANIRDALIALKPQDRQQLVMQADRYLSQIAALEDKLRTEFAAIAQDQRRIIVSHDAFGYLAKAYNIEFLPVQGGSTGREASASDVANLIRQVRNGNVRAYFVENMSDPRVLQRIADETGAKAGGRLYSDALSAPGTEADTYLRLYETNAQRLIDALRN